MSVTHISYNVTQYCTQITSTDPPNRPCTDIKLLQLLLDCPQFDCRSSELLEREHTRSFWYESIHSSSRWVNSLNFLSLFRDLANRTCLFMRRASSTKLGAQEALRLLGPPIRSIFVESMINSADTAVLISRHQLPVKYLRQFKYIAVPSNLKLQRNKITKQTNDPLSA